MSEEIIKTNSSQNSLDPLLDSPDMTSPSQAELLGDEVGKSNRVDLFWEQISHAGLIEPVLRIGTVVFSIVLVLIVVWGLQTYLADFSVGQVSVVDSSAMENSAFVALEPTATPVLNSPGLPAFSIDAAKDSSGVFRLASLRTTIPTRPRVNVITYTVQAGDSIFAIAENFGLKPETILWANSAVLRDNPHRLQVDQVLNILPTNGTYHKWTAGENLEQVAEFYRVDPSAITDWLGNPFDIFNNDFRNPNIEPGTMLIVPGGQREMIDYGPPRIPRDNPAIARTYGPGHCGVLTDGLIGDGLFMWPAPAHFLSGYDYSPETNHHGIDISGDTGDPIWSVDDGVVVYAGWSYSGYGNLVVVDHGNEWQSLYAHLDTVFVTCGMSVYQGAQIATMGNTGNSSGSHLHLELLYGSTKVNPWNFLP